MTLPRRWWSSDLDALFASNQPLNHKTNLCPACQSTSVFPEDIDDHVVLREHIFQVLEGDDYWHDRIRRILGDAGIATRRLEREEAHPIWQAWLTRISFDLDADNKRAIRQLRKVLADGGLEVVRDEFNIIDRRGDKLRCVFILALGSAGVA